MKNIKLLNFISFLIFIIALISCRNHSNGLSNGSFKEYEDADLKVSTVNGEWKGNEMIKPTAIIQSMKVIFQLNLDNIKPEAYPFDSKKYTSTDLQYSLLFNEENLLPEFLNYKGNSKSGALYSSLNDSSGVFFETRSLSYNSAIKLIVPVYFMKKFKAGTDVKVKVRVWQDYFISEKSYDQNPGKSVSMSDTRDTLRKKLIDNVYSFSFKMPTVFKTEIICDSFALQNNEKWSPGGSDNTLFKSSYPDLFYLLEDYAYFDQASSHIEKSTAKFEMGDTVALYRYKLHEPFKLKVYDYDYLSKNDVLGDTLLDPESISDNNTTVLAFRHVERFYLRKKNYGKIN